MPIPMREPNPRAKIFATRAQYPRLARRTAAPVSQRSEERWVEGDIEGRNPNTFASSCTAAGQLVSAATSVPTSARATPPSGSRRGLKIVTSMPTARSLANAAVTTVSSSSKLRPPGSR